MKPDRQSASSIYLSIDLLINCNKESYAVDEYLLHVGLDLNDFSHIECVQYNVLYFNRLPIFISLDFRIYSDLLNSAFLFQARLDLQLRHYMEKHYL